MPELETVTLPAVEVLSTGGPVHGVGSPPEGDFWTRADLEVMATAARELAGEIRAPMKIGHSAAQTMLANSGLPLPSPGEMPAVGWLDGATAMVVDDPATGGAKLVMDAKAVPKQFAQLLNAGAYRTRSSELARITSQVTQKTYDWVVTGLAWLGAKLPAVQTLDDVVALYESADLRPPEGVRAYVVVAADDGAGVTQPQPTPASTTVVWAPDSSFQSLRDDVSEALNGPPTGGMTNPRFWVCDIALTGDAALVQDYYEDGDNGWVVPFTRDQTGSVQVSPSSDWQPVEQGWLAAGNEYEREFHRRAESRSMPELTLTEEQVATLKEKLGDSFEGTADEILAAFDATTAKVSELEARANEAETRKLEGDDRLRDLEAKAEKGEQAAQRLYEMERDQLIADCVKAAKLDPADVEETSRDYDANPELTKRFLMRLKPREELLRELGREDFRENEVSEDEYKADAARRLGLDPEAVR